MIGNDIVDLNLAEKQSNWRRKGFLEKVYSSNEQAMIQESSMPDVLIWKLWSMKESAYKARLRVDKRVQLNPTAFECQILSEDKGIVSCDGKIYHTVSQINNNFVHTQALVEEFDTTLFSKVINVNQNISSSKELYKVIISSVAISMCCDESDMVLEKNRLGIPELYRMGKKMLQLCSLSHHGRYGSYVITNYQKKQN
jgi:phosphopantetheinyl transferase (holo-ACP synthase)